MVSFNIFYFSQLCLDIAVKKIKEGQNKQKVVKFLLHDTTIQKYEPIIEGCLNFYIFLVYIEECDFFVLILNVDREETLLTEKLKTLKNKIKHPGSKQILPLLLKPHE